MSRIGNEPVVLPAGVQVTRDGNIVTVKGPNGELKQEISDRITFDIEDNKIVLKRASDSRQDREQHGLARALINNMVTGVTKGFEKKLIINGVGFRAEKKGKKLVMQLGFSHPVEMEDPEGITTETPDQNTIIVKGADKAQVGNYAAIIRSWRKPEPYKGKGIRYEDEHVRRKEGKTGATA
ncbi:MAG: 50S ribosomal protein L6 [Anaerovoracaceae bacterium]|jgi:large subunit ribosomal protein L6